MASKKTKKLVEENTNYIIEYWNAIQSGEVVVCKKIYAYRFIQQSDELGI